MKIVHTFIFVLLNMATLLAQTESDSREAIYTYWAGNKATMTLQELASYCAPIFWFSPDEPLLDNKSGKDIRMPQYFPFEDSTDAPVVYYQLRDILSLPDKKSPAFTRKENLAESMIDLRSTGAFHMDYLHYYPSEAGTGSHEHDTEMVQFKVYVHRDTTDKENIIFKLIFLQATATAHAVRWYENIYTTDIDNVNWDLQLPFHVFVEEGKHASCTDMNGDGFYSPGYDVNVRTNDAWGVKDVVRTGKVYSPTFESWMVKPRRPQHQVFPPLPLDSPLRKKHSRDGIYARDNAIYQLRAVPALEAAAGDRLLQRDMSSYVAEELPLIKKDTDVNRFFEWWETHQLIKSLAIAARADDALGVAFSFPLLITKNVEVPMIGGWLVNRVYLQDHDLRDFGYGLLYTPSASRFLDPYFCAGFEYDRYDDSETGELKSRTDFVFETGIKLRTTVSTSFLRFLNPITDFWGVRLGIKNRGFMRIDQLTYVFEIGAGVW